MRSPGRTPISWYFFPVLDREWGIRIQRILKVKGVFPYFLFRYLEENNLTGSPLSSSLAKVVARQ